MSIAAASSTFLTMHQIFLPMPILGLYTLTKSLVFLRVERYGALTAAEYALS
jgi:hypothetical protein